jgi:very-short-patch-repair endonuclease
MRFKKFSANEIKELSKTYDLSLPKPTLKQLRKRYAIQKQKNNPKPKKTKKERRSRIKKYAKRLRENLPASERWFLDMWPYKELSNIVLGNRIPDIMNKDYRYIIEIDGSFHDSPEQKHIDMQKDCYYRSKGYKAFRVKAYDMQSYNECLIAIKELRLTKPN